MKYSPELHLLVLTCFATALMWLPYVAARGKTLGPLSAMGNPGPAFFGVPTWAQRAKAAHANAVENLVVFAPLVLIAAAIGISTPATALASKIYFVARVVHYVVYTAGVPVVRTLAFLAGFGATVTFAVVILRSVM
ncbi:MAPEG family protein [Cedecea neteri]|uniref:MAPEG family protein n=1 Tax=Cedecea neteri TaxID=158822 RepID=UPI0028930804|nr:MAPEG family protein [Cedecea neteri]WNJ79722.1 MAPEG family protein [Cedecea neteri]